jgi:D-glycerate 3-kinase
MLSLAQALEETIALARGRAGSRAPLVGVAGAQGSGKTSLTAGYLAAHPRTAGFSLDDFYHARAERERLARQAHPLFATRGVPGTHDITALNATLNALLAAKAGDVTAIRAFDKIADDVRPEQEWPRFAGAADVILVEGWCLGARWQTYAEIRKPVNALEAKEDKTRFWRWSADALLASAYHRLFCRFDAILFLAAPDWSVVEQWRCEQQETLLGRKLTREERGEIARFVAHFERITRHMLAGGVRADVVARLDEARGVIAVER